MSTVENEPYSKRRRGPYKLYLSSELTSIPRQTMHSRLKSASSNRMSDEPDTHVGLNNDDTPDTTISVDIEQENAFSGDNNGPMQTEILEMDDNESGMF
jgi:hypothetical protein